MRPVALYIALFLFTAHSIAQCPSNKYQWEFCASYGLLGNDMLHPGSDFLGTAVTSSPHATSLTVRYFLYNRLAVGYSAVFSGAAGTFTSFRSYNISGGYKVSCNVAAVELYYIYFFRKYMEVYAFAGAGPAFISESLVPASSSSDQYNISNSEKIKGQITPLGIRLGGRLGAFAEIGYGYKGIANAGVSFKLGPACWWKDRFR